ncbi:PREDICTED: ceramide synthase 5-like [Polistes dominula]|uniref:Ceramide synthase 5-like n=1 Tax=Polistes dominula TaxID=743375 RepID=A0ABM1I5V4_POLDO|nr:PREDICTED: ceramide synthase 5-like [Polistes dominula]
MDSLKSMLSAICSAHMWLPPNVTWDRVLKYTGYSLFLYSIPLAIILAIIKYFLERHFFVYFGKYLGVNDTKVKKAPPNEILEKAYINKKLQGKQILALAKQLDWSERKIERWIRIRRSQDKPSTLTKFCECGWRFAYATWSFLYGLIILWNKPWLWDIKQCYDNYPDHVVTNDVWWFYAMTAALYLLLSVSQFFEVRRKDFWANFVHHIICNLLLYSSWITNWTRIGALFVFIHDPVLIFIEIAKMTHYANYQRTCHIAFIIFITTWTITHLTLFPFWIIRSMWFQFPRFNIHLTYVLFMTLACLLFLLHIFWTWFILKTTYSIFLVGKIQRDSRSESEHSDTENFDDNMVINNTTTYIGKQSHKQKTR